ncbi:MAG: aldehyde ferredoxin oxidoreductase family protein [Bacillota bacterium]|nr:aldehyde ferredoxin oxidoreductase family protein [Bacillota bacterium]
MADVAGGREPRGANGGREPRGASEGRDTYAGKVLRVDLGTLSSWAEPLNREWARLFFGGKGLGFRYFYDAVPAGTDPLAPGSALVFVTGPLTGTLAPCTGKLGVVTRSPATGTILDCSVGGTVGPQLKYAGYDLVVITGRAPHPVVLVIDDDRVWFRDGDDVWGKGCHETEFRLRDSLGEGFRIISTGPAGENLVPMACLTSELYRQAGRGGVGAVMGSKHLKAVAVRGTGALVAPDMGRFLEFTHRAMREDLLTDTNLWAYTDGTPMIVGLSQSAGILPTRNFQSGTFAAADAIGAEAVRSLRVAKKSCFGCGLGCGNFLRAPAGSAGSGGAAVGGGSAAVGGGRGAAGWPGEGTVEGPEYETLALTGSNCGIGDLGAVIEFNRLCDDLGLDTISTGGVVAFAMELAERDLADLGLRFGDVESYLRAPVLIARAEGVGKELGRGVRYLAGRYGGREFAMEVKGLEFPGYEPRGSWGMALAYATADRGACHMRAWPVADEAFGSLDPFTGEGKAQLVINGQHQNSVKFSLIFCDFWALSLELMAGFCSVALGREVTAEELRLAGERIWNLGRLLNVREGFRREHDYLPGRVLEEPLPDGPAAGKVVPAEVFRAMLDEYYCLRGWDEAGVPTPARLAELGLGGM